MTNDDKTSTRKPSYYRGGLRSNAKLLSQDIPLIRSSTDSLRDIARRFGVSVGAISAIRSRRTWKHIP